MPCLNCSKAEPDALLRAQNEALQDEVQYLRQLLTMAGATTTTDQTQNSPHDMSHPSSSTSRTPASNSKTGQSVAGPALCARKFGSRRPQGSQASLSAAPLLCFAVSYSHRMEVVSLRLQTSSWLLLQLVMLVGHDLSEQVVLLVPVQEPVQGELAAPVIRKANAAASILLVRHHLGRPAV